ncbi:vacuolar segregation subunit 7-domain-containing protein [Coniella lustricola]|uniref:Vacuolar segregation subunit 7-domain-containing protein n=1 Tax=Coniella lustricola TaxID=2025994 RepID=A0A2T3A422_9PEZI|nr:vacuolar segregation subunit 7-domain-containing protein [Coniella lustricola]
MDTTTDSAPGSSDPTANAPPEIRRNRESSSSASTIKAEASSQRPAHTSRTRSSPLSSREPSPNRSLLQAGPTKPASTPAAAVARSRKTGAQDTNPSRTPKYSAPTSSSSGKISTASRTPKLGPVATDSTARGSAPQKSPVHAEHLKESHRWPVSPRLRSPPPVSTRPNYAPSRRVEQDQLPSIQVQRSSPQIPQQQHLESSQSDTDGDEARLQATPTNKTSTRGSIAGPSTSALETVQEASPLPSPQHTESMLERMDDSAMSETGSQIDLLEFTRRKSWKARASPSTHNDSGSDSGSIKGERGPAATSVPPSLTSRQSSASVRTNATAKAKPSEGSAQHMTVETETVASVPQVSLAPTGLKEGGGGTLRTKPSSETIRPRKEKKKTSRKPPVGTGTASSKADIFEAKIASAVDEVDSSDSEETFVYDSNPPDVSDRPRRYHSRTPSATSMVSQIDRPGLRSLSNLMDNGGPSAIKRNMKFVNAFNSSGNESPMMDEEGKGSVRTNPGSGRGSTSRVHHHHYGRWGRNGTNGHTSLFDNDAPFHANITSAPRSKFSTNNGLRQASGPPSPRFLHAGRLNATSKRGAHSASYDLDDTTGADDERTPLLHNGSIRSARANRSRRQPVSIRTLESQSYRRTPSMLNRFASCLVLTVMLLLVVSGAIGFMFATSQPLTEVELKSINMVIASESELMFDLSVQAHNPNVVVVVVDQADIEVFAKSPHAGANSQWLHFGRKDGQNPDGTWGGGDAPHGSDPDEPVDDTAPNMRLGSISHLDSSLSFEGSFFNQGVSASTGEVRLLKPGNGTFGGPERWERILQDEFDLVIKGVLKYSLPLSQRVRSVAISGRATVKPNSADNPSLKPNTTEPIKEPKRHKDEDQLAEEEENMDSLWIGK